MAVRAMKYQGKLYLIMANTDVKTRQISVQIPGNWKSSNGETVAEDNGTRWTYHCAPRDSVVFSFRPGNP
jgi:hypothetical protein